jgi:hypothetical protein
LQLLCWAPTEISPTSHSPSSRGTTHEHRQSEQRVHATAVVNEIISLGREWATVHEQQVTERARIAADKKKTLAEIHARRDIFLTYLDRSFDERQKNFEQLFARLDTALETDSSAVPDLLSSISTLATHSPFADLRDAADVRRKLDDPAAEWVV